MMNSSYSVDREMGAADESFQFDFEMIQHASSTKVIRRLINSAGENRFVRRVKLDCSTCSIFADWPKTFEKLAEVEAVSEY